MGSRSVACRALAVRFQAAQRRSVIDHLPIRPECHDVLAALKSRGLYLATVSNIDDDYLHPLVEKHGLHHDVAGASAAGLRSARIAEPDISTPLTSGLPVSAEPDFQITTLSELVGIVDALNGHNP
jgi:FMN phosphatase YigB (HAD superfamily)